MEILNLVDYFMNYENYSQSSEISSNGFPIDKVEGFYCILYVGNKNDIPIWMKNSMENKASEFLYFGKSNNLRRRVAQELKGKKHGTFFRTIGAVLDFTPPVGQLINYANKRNYWFDEDDKNAIISWLNTNTKIAYLENVHFDEQINIEKILISNLNTILNMDFNDDVPNEIINKRERCREIANRLVI